MTDETSQLVSRWKIRLFVTVIIAAGFVCYYPMFICGCSFHPEALLVTAIPVGWGFFALLTYRDRKEQVVGWVAFVIAWLSVWCELVSNLAYASFW